jgi:hypothetical protein
MSRVTINDDRDRENGPRTEWLRLVEAIGEEISDRDG